MNRFPPAWVFNKPEYVAKKYLSKAIITKNGKVACRFHWNTVNTSWSKGQKDLVWKTVRIQDPSRSLAMGKDKESHDGNDFITIFKVGDKELPSITLFYSFVILMYYFLMSVWLWVLLYTENIMWLFSARYHQKNTSSIIRWPRKPSKPPDPIKGLNHGQITDLNKVKINTLPFI